MTNILKTGYYIFSTIFGIAQIIAIIGLIIWGIAKLIKLFKKNNLTKNKPLLLSVICIVIATLSLVLNIGWIRFCMIIMLIPIIHPILFLWTNLYASKLFVDSPGLRITNYLFIATYLIFWVLLPDGGDIGPTYCLFNLVRNEVFTDVAWIVSGIAGIAHIVLFIIQIIEFVKLKKESK